MAELKGVSDKFVMEEGILYRLYKVKIGSTTKRLVVPQSKRKYLLQLAHTSLFSAHLGSNRTLERLQRNFYWPGLVSDVRRYVNLYIKKKKNPIIVT